MSLLSVVDPPESLLPSDFGKLCTSTLIPHATTAPPDEASPTQDLREIDLGELSKPLPSGRRAGGEPTVKELRDTCKRLGLKSTGKKDDLLARLKLANVSPEGAALPEGALDSEADADTILIKEGDM